MKEWSHPGGKSQGELMFLLPADLTAGHYTLEVRDTLPRQHRCAHRRAGGNVDRGVDFSYNGGGIGGGRGRPSLEMPWIIEEVDRFEVV